jgi:hypothetical protein
VLRIRIGHDAAHAARLRLHLNHFPHRSFISSSTFSQNHRTVFAIILLIFAFQHLSIAKKPQTWTG